jgi:hypothetical protein
MDKIWQWINVNGLWLGLFSVITFIASLLIIPVIVTRIPADYFVDRQRHLSQLKRLHPVVYFALLVLKNLFGGLLVLAGIAMLVLPGQGILTVLIGITLMNFPGKYALERRLVSQPGVFKAINWIRKRAGKQKLMHPSIDVSGQKPQ